MSYLNHNFSTSLNCDKYEIFEDGDGILTVEEYKAAFHEHGVFVGLKTRYKSVLRILMTRRGMDKRNDEEN